MLRKLCAIFILLLSFKAVAQKKEPLIIVKNKSDLLLIGKQVLFLEDPNQALSISDMLEDSAQQKLELLEKYVFARPATNSVFWFKINVSNQTDEDIWLEVATTYAWKIDFYRPDSIGRYSKVIQTGTMRADETKLQPVNTFWLPLNEKGDKNTHTYYLRVESGLTFELPLYVGTITSLHKNKDIGDFLTASFVGIMLIMILYNIFLFFSIKNKIYLFYVGYLFLMMVSMPYANAYPFIQYFIFDKTLWNNYFLFWHPFVYLFVGLFCIHYLELSKIKGKFAYYLILTQLSLISIVTPILTLFGVKFVDLVNPFQVVLLFFYFTCLITGYYYALKKEVNARFYALGWTFMIIGVFTFFMTINGILPFNAITRNALYFGVVMEAWMFSLALGHRWNLLKKEKELIQKNNLELISNQKQFLEQKVQEQTAQLQEAYQNLQTSHEELKQNNEELSMINQKLNEQSELLKAVNADKDKLFAIIGHDLRSPIASLESLLNLLIQNNLSQTEFTLFSKQLKVSIENVRLILNNLLEWANSQLQGIITKPEVFQPYLLAEENKTLFQDITNHKQISIINNIDDTIEVWADLEQVRLIFRNLLSNAIKFSYSQGKILLESQIIGETLLLSVKDTGTGMSEATKAKLFNNNTYISLLGTQNEKGTGIGLLLCKDFVERNGGEMRVESIEKEGTTFYFTLPLARNNEV